jgi:hypothetical protein
MNTKLVLFLLIATAAPLACPGQTTPAPLPKTEAPPPLRPSATPQQPVAMQTNTPPDGEVEEIIAFDELPLPDAIQQLAKLAGFDVQFDPALLNQKAADGTPIPPPSVKEKWKQVTAMQALQALLLNYGWQTQRFANNPMVLIRAKDSDPVGPLFTKVNLSKEAPTGVIFSPAWGPFTKANLSEKARTGGAAASAKASATGGDEVIETISFDHILLPDALRNLAILAGMNIQFDPRLSNPQDAHHLPIPSPTVNEKMQHVTARQAMQALLDEFGWQAAQMAGNPILRIEAKEPKAPDASAKPPQPR